MMSGTPYIRDVKHYFTSERICPTRKKGQWVYLVAFGVAYGAYFVIALGQLGQTAPADIDYVPTMLWSIGIGIALAIVGRIVVEIVSRISARSRVTTEAPLRTSATVTSGASASTSPARCSASAWSCRSS